jgi:polygalacturonase
MKKGFIVALFIGVCEWGYGQVNRPATDPWATVKQIEANIKAPSFPDRTFLITDYGAVSDASTDCTAAIAKAIAACSNAGGGRVVVPAGKFLSGPIHLESNVNLHLSKNAVILFSQDTKKYLPQVITRFEGVELMNYSPFIYAFEKENIAITGDGELNGQADGQHWWFWKGKWEDMERMGVTWKDGMPTQVAANNKLKELAKKNTPVGERVFGEGDYLRPNFIQPYKCRNVLIENITIRNSPMWVIHPVLSVNVTVKNVKVDSHGPNNDGCDPESCSNVLIEGCFFDTGDDCIAIKSGRDDDGRRINMPTENVIIRNCTMKDGHGGVVIGSEITGNVMNVFAEKCDMSSPNLDRALRIKSNSKRGGRIENIFMRDCTVGVVADAVFLIELFYSNETGENHPMVRNVQMKNVNSKKSKYAIRIMGEEQYPVDGITIENCTFGNVAKENSIKGVKSINLKNVTINGNVQ